MDTTKLEFICEQCAQSITLTLRQAHRGVKPACPTCGPTAPLTTALKRIRQNRTGDT